MGTVVLIDGQPVAAETASVSVFDRGFLYGDAVFETIGTYGGVPFALAAHLERLAKSAASVLIRLPVPVAQLADEIARALSQSENAESYVRVMVTRGRSTSLGLDPALGSSPCRVIIVTPLLRPSASDYQKGITAVTFQAARPADNTSASGAKIANYLVAVLAMERARSAGAAEALLVDPAGHVIEGATSNLFVVFDDRLVTAPESAGILAGITRAHTLQVAAELGLPVEERAVAVDELWQASELFISSTIRELMPVVAVDGRVIGSGAPGPLSQRLHAAFRRVALASVAAGAGAPGR